MPSEIWERSYPEDVSWSAPLPPPWPVEEAIYEHPAVAEVTVIGVPDSYRGELAKVLIVLKQGQTLGFDDLKSFLKDKLGRHELPAEMELRESLPKTPIGKLSKKELIAEERRKRRLPP